VRGVEQVARFLRRQGRGGDAAGILGLAVQGQDQGQVALLHRRGVGRRRRLAHHPHRLTGLAGKGVGEGEVGLQADIARRLGQRPLIQHLRLLRPAQQGQRRALGEDRRHVVRLLGQGLVQHRDGFLRPALGQLHLAQAAQRIDIVGIDRQRGVVVARGPRRVAGLHQCVTQLDHRLRVAGVLGRGLLIQGDGGVGVAGRADVVTHPQQRGGRGFAASHND